MRLPALDQAGARLVIRGIGASALVVGGGSVVIPRLGLRIIGVEADGRGVGLMARLFGCRDLALGAALLRVAGDERPDRRWLDMIALTQVGDILLILALHRTGHLSRRGLVTVMVSAPPTLVMAVAARRVLG